MINKTLGQKNNSQKLETLIFLVTEIYTEEYLKGNGFSYPEVCK